MLSRYLRVVKNHEGFSWYESEVHPRIVGKILKRPIMGRSYEMSPTDYKEWLSITGMDMIYGYLPWHWGRVNRLDEWGRFQYVSPDAKVGDYIPCSPLDKLNKRMDELLEIKGSRGLEWALYNTPQLAVDALGLEQFCFEMTDQPEKLLLWMQTLDEEVEAELKSILEKPVDVVQISQYLADKNGPLFNDEQMEIFHLSFLRSRVKEIHAAGKLASLHCDGDCKKLYQRLADIGIDIFNSYNGSDQTHDVRKWRKSFAFRGSIPLSPLEHGSPEEIDALVDFRCKELGSHIIGSWHDVNEVPLGNFIAMMNAAQRWSNDAA